MATRVDQSDFVTDLLSRSRFPVGPVACAVSGGPDSMAMLFLAVAAGCNPTAYHVDHGLRPTSTAEADLVGELCDRLGVRFTRLRADIVDGPNLEARARDARRALLPPGALTGHTADDQAETVLLNLMRGSGTDGLAGMRYEHGKPLLDIRRVETHRLCHDEGITVASDESNDDPRFRRNRVRHELLPLLDDIARRDVAALVSRQSHLIADDEKLLRDLAMVIDVTDAVQLAAAPLPLARRAIRTWLSDPYPPDSAAVERVLDVARGVHPGCEVGGGRRVVRTHQRLRLV